MLEWWKMSVWVQNYHACEKDCVWNPSTSNCENGIYLASIMDDSAIMCDEIKETNFNEKKGTCKTQIW